MTRKKALLNSLGRADPIARLHVARTQAEAGDPAGDWRALDVLAKAMVRLGRSRQAPMRAIFALLGDRWTMLILLTLETGMWRHAMLRRIVGALSIEGRISQRVLTQKLRALERDGLVLRDTSDDVPPHVTYRLSARGMDLVVRTRSLMDWIETHHEDIERSRAAFDARERP